MHRTPTATTKMDSLFRGNDIEGVGMAKEEVKTTKETDGFDETDPYILVMTDGIPVLP